VPYSLGSGRSAFSNKDLQRFHAHSTEQIAMDLDRTEPDLFARSNVYLALAIQVAWNRLADSAAPACLAPLAWGYVP